MSRLWDATRDIVPIQWSIIMSEVLYTAELAFTGKTEFGLSLEAVLSGAAPIPPQGARFDVTFAGPLEGKLDGTLTGVDYLRMRADGRTELDLHGVVERPNGQKIAWRAEGVGTMRADAPIMDITELIRFDSADPDTAWLGTRRVWGEGQVDPVAGVIRVTAYV